MTTAITRKPPTLVVEVMSPNERMSTVNRRIIQFLLGGVAAVWLLDPEEQAIMIFRPDGPPEVLEGNEELTGDGAMPGFRSRVAEFFFMPSEANGGATPPVSSHPSA